MQKIPSRDRRLLMLMSHLDRRSLENRLNSCDDRSLAVALLYYAEDERERVLSLVHSRKASRVTEEISFLRQRRIGSQEFYVITGRLIQYLLHGGTFSAVRSYRKKHQE